MARTVVLQIEHDLTPIIREAIAKAEEQFPNEILSATVEGRVTSESSSMVLVITIYKDGE